ncbi:MAG: hypothetical protein ACNA8W_23105 [Bradymonadaceae bacterium]
MQKLPRRSYRAVLTSALVILAFLAMTLPGQSAEAARWEISEDAFVDFHYLLQGWAQLTTEGSDRRTVTGPTLSVRRSRILLRGQITPTLGFMLGTGNDLRAGTFEIWDALTWLNVDRALVIDTGLVMLPFLRHAQQFSVNLHTVEFMRTAFLYPRESTSYRRAPGVRARGLLLGDRVDYRIAATTGAPTESSRPRLTGRVGLNFLDPEPGYILPGTYFGNEQVITLGGAYDFQPEVVMGDRSYYAFGGDLFWSVPTGTHRITGQVAVVYYRGLNALDEEDLPIVADRTGVGTIVDAGYAFGAVEPVISAEWFRPQSADRLQGQRLGARLGLNWWVMGPTLNLKIDGGFIKEPGQVIEDASPVVTVQLQTRLP